MSATGNVAYLRIEADVKNARAAVQQLDKDFTVLDSGARKAGSGVAEFGKQTAKAEANLKEMTGRSRQDWAKFQRELTTATVSGAQARELAIKREFASKRKELRQYLSDGRVSQERHDKWLAALNDAQARKLNKQHTEELKSVSTLDKGYAKLATTVKAFVGAYVGYKGLELGVRIGNASYQSFKEFESATTDMSKITSRELGKIKTEITELPAVLGNSTALMRGYYQSISAQAADPLDALVTASKSAKAAHVEQAETIKALTKLMAGFSGEIKTATDASDLLFAIEKQGQTSFGELVPIIGEVASVSKQAGVSQYEMGAALAAMTQTAGSTSQAATQYKAVIMGLFKPQEEMRKALSALGFESGQAAVQALGFAGALQALDGYATKSGVGLGKLFESSEALTGIGPMLATSFSKYNTNLEEMQKSAGGTDRAFKEWQKTSEATGEVLDNTLGKFAVKFGQELAPAINREMGALTTWLNDNKDGIYTGFEDIAKGVSLLGDAARASWSAYRYLTLKIAGGIAIARGEVPTNQVVQFMQADIAEMEQMLSYFGKLKHTLAADAANMQNVVMIGSVIEPGSLEREYFKELEGIKDAWMLSNNYIGQHSKSTVDEIVEHAVSGGALISKEEMKEIEKRIKAGKKEADAYSAGVVARSVVTKEQEAAITKALEEHREQRRKKAEDLHKKMFAGIEQLDAGYWTKRRSDLDTQYEYLKGQVEDKKALEVWYHQETQQIEQDHLRSSYESRAAQADNWLEYAQNMAQAESDVWQDARTRELDHWRSYYDATKGLLLSFGADAQSVTASALFDGLKGQWKDLEDYTQQILDSMLRSMSEYAVKMAAEWAGSKLMSWGSSLLDGIFTFHSGTMAIKDDELFALLQRGEMVIPAKQADAIRTAMGGEGLSKDQFFDRVVDSVSVGGRSVQPLDRSQFGDYVLDKAFGLDFGGRIGTAYSSLFGGGMAFHSNYGRVQDMAGSLQNAGIEIPQDRIDDVALDAGIAGFSSAMFSGLGGLVGDVVSYGLGVAEYADVAKLINAGLVSVLGLGIPGALAGALSPLTAYAVSGVADVFGLRSNESLRDAFEDTLGGLTGRQTYQALGNDFTFDVGPNGTLKLKNRVTQVVEFFANYQAAAEWLSQHYNEERAGGRTRLIEHNYLTFGREFSSPVWDYGSFPDKLSLAFVVRANQEFASLDTINEARKVFQSPEYVDYSRAVRSGIVDSLRGSGWGDYSGGSEDGSGSGYDGPGADMGGGWSHSGGWSSGLGRDQRDRDLADFADSLSGNDSGWGGKWSGNSGSGGYGSNSGVGGDSSYNGGKWADGGVVDRLVVPQGEDGFGALRLGEGVVSRDGMELLAKINSGADVTVGDFESWRDSAKSQLEKLLQEQISLKETELKRQEQFYDQFTRYAGQMREARLGNWTNESLTILSPAQQYALQRTEFEQLARRARLGDTDAIEELTSVSTDFLQSSKETNSNWSAYRSDFLLVQQTLADVETLSTRHATSAESQAEILRAQLTTSQAELNTLKGISTQIVTLAQARAEYQSAQSALQQAANQAQQSGGFDVAGYRAAKVTKLVADGKYETEAQALAGYLANLERLGMTDKENWERWGKGHVPGYASGGYHLGGLRLVGETGPELEVTGPAQYFSTGQTASAFGVWDRMLDSMLGTRSEIAELRLDLEAMGSSIITELQLMRDVLEKWDRTGLPRERAA